MSIVGKAAPDFAGVAAYNGEKINVNLAGYKGKWLYLFFYPLDFTFVCPTELVALSDAAPKFKEAGCELLGCSVDSVHTHLAWTRTARADAGVGQLAYPLLADLGGKVAEAYDVLMVDKALRAAILIDPDGKVQSAWVNNLDVGRNIEEMYRLLKGYQYAREHGEVCPANWQVGSAGMKATLDGVKKVIG